VHSTGDLAGGGNNHTYTLHTSVTGASPQPRGNCHDGAAMRPRIAIAALALLSAAALLVVAFTRSAAPAGHAAPGGRAAATERVTPALTPAESTSGSGGVVTDPIDPRYLTVLRFGRISFWVQPWRAYLDTWPAARLTDAVGINFNVAPADAQAVARLLHDSGFKLARIELGWGGLSYADPAGFVNEASVRTRLDALHAWGLRPLILLNANSGAPCPAERLQLVTTAAAPAGASTIALSAASAAAVVPGRTGLDARAFGVGRAHRSRAAAAGAGAAGVAAAGAGAAGVAAAGARAAGGRATLSPEQRRQRHEQRRAQHRAELQAGITPLVREGNPAILITKVSAHGVATLSRPLPAALPAGAHPATKLLYAPFAAPTLPSGAPNPAFQATLRGWLDYVATVARIARSIFGRAGYDLEVWNELGFGSQFLDAESYSQAGGGAGAAQTGEAQTRAGEAQTQEGEDDPGQAQAAKAHTSKGKIVKAVTKTLLEATVAYVRKPANGISPAVGISDGFASQTPFFSAAYAPPGLTAYSKHPYAGPRSFPAALRPGRAAVPVDALGRRDTVGTGHSVEALTPRYVPSYQSLLPEYALTATSTETLARDLAPFTTYVYKAPHGRHVAPPHSAAPQMWVTEYNLGTGNATPVGPDETTPDPTTLTPADKEHFETKVVLRSLTSMINKGATREYFFAAAPGALSLINPTFYTDLQTHPGTYPGDQAGGETLHALHNLLTHLQGPGPQGTPRQLKLTTITQEGNHAQFTGQGTPNHPNLYDRDVLAVLPFQTSPTSYAIPIYVMTRDLLTLYQPSAPTNDPTRFDLPNETFHITLTNLPHTTTPPTITAYDPITNTNTPTQLTNWASGTATIQIAATDYPRILTINFTGAADAHH
jgi:hypothetical protein